MWLRNQWLWDMAKEEPVQLKELRLSCDTKGKAQLVYVSASAEDKDISIFEYSDFRKEVAPRFTEIYSKDGKARF
jgi:hypothetical protein